MSDYPSTLASLALWLDGRAQAYSDAAGTVAAAAPLGRAARVNDFVSGSWLSPNTTDARPFAEAGAVRCEPVPTTGNYGGLRLNAPAGATLPANAYTLAGSFLHLTSPVVSPGTIRGIAYGLDGGGQCNLPLIINGEFCVYYGGTIWHSGFTIPLFSQVNYVLRVQSTGIDVTFNIGGTVTTPSPLVAAVASGTISNIALGPWPALNGIGNNQSVMQVVGVGRYVTNTERDNLLAWLAALTPPSPFPATSYRLTQSGDSIGANYGINAPDGCEYSSLPAIEAARPDIRFLNLSTPSDTIVGQASKFASTIAPLYSASCPLHVHVIQCATNSIALGSKTAAQNIADVSALCDAAHALGSNVKVVLATCLPRDDAGIRGTFETDRQTYNTWVRTQAVTLGKADTVWDVCVTHMGASGDADNTTYYQSDKVHPNATGHGLMAAGFLAAVLSFSPAPPVVFPAHRLIPLPGGTMLDAGNDPTVVSFDDPITLHTPLALSRLIERWKNKPNLAAILASYTDQLQLLENTLWEVIILRFTDYAAGAQQDVIGRIVGEERQGQNDAQYRARLKVRIRINQSFGTPEDVIEVLQMLDPALFLYQELGHAFFQIVYLSRPVSSAVASQVAGIVRQTRAAGIGATVTIPADNTRGARFGTTRNTAINQHIGFGTTRNQTTGGVFAHIVKA